MTWPRVDAEAYAYILGSLVGQGRYVPAVRAALIVAVDQAEGADHLSPTDAAGLRVAVLTGDPID